ncbi:MAG: isoamylase early set domain-containing protein [Desulfobacterales bacterium]|jgi:1,4-alpha-glucan branching enzyme|nr:isoamylase early set domain-containing protein [Desulfobacteraceae bacterium]MDD3991173.1 isoamylase early set domain-containing protein [Desulfobacteraceae bacterium]MDY0311621.1 isoamylase early set domain-containing protein [Desulfobacterales bacterium]
MSIKKQYLKTRPVCKVTFHLTRDEVGETASVHLVGDFNDWSTSASPLKRRKDGSFNITLDFAIGKDYQFRYLVDGLTWLNDPQADGYVPSGFQGSDNSVVSV